MACRGGHGILHAGPRHLGISLLAKIGLELSLPIYESFSPTALDAIWARRVGGKSISTTFPQLDCSESNRDLSAHLCLCLMHVGNCCVSN